MGFAKMFAKYGMRKRKEVKDDLRFWPEPLQGWRGHSLQGVTDWR